MERCIDQSLLFVNESSDSGPLPDPRASKYQLAERLIDNIRFGEAIRILETLGDYGDSPALLAQVKALKAYQDMEESRLKAQRKQQALDRAEREARDARRRRIFYIVAAAACLVAMIVFR